MKTKTSKFHIVLKIKNIQRVVFLGLLLFPLIGSFSFSQVPEKMSYQAVIRNSNGELVIDQNVGIRIQIKQGSEFGAAVYVETHTTKTNSNGMVTLEVGGGTIVSGSFVTIDWISGPYFLQTETDPAGGANYSIVGVSQLLTVPYAMYAITAENIAGGFAEKDPVFGTSVARDIKEADIRNWNNKLNNYTESDPLFGASVAKGITSADTGKWNKKLNTENQNLAAVLTKGNNGNGLQIKNISNPTDALDVAPKAYVDYLSAQLDMLKNTINSGAALIDVDGNQYNTVKIGNQIWMAENLKTKKFKDFESIPLVSDSKWDSLSTPAYCWYGNDETSYKNPYGALYNYHAVNTGKLCPEGWRVPSYYDWSDLMTYAGSDSVAGGKLKENGTIHWFSPNKGAENTFGFYAVPSGYKIYDFKAKKYSYSSLGFRALWWSSTSDFGNSGWDYEISYNSTIATKAKTDTKSGLSVRCIKESNSKIVHIPMVYTDSISSVTDSSAIVGGVVSADGGSQIIAKGICWDTIPNPDTTNHVILDTNTSNQYKINLIGLLRGKRYYTRAFAMNNAGIGYGKVLDFRVSPGNGYLADVEYNYYATVKIGNQTWMAENLKTTHYKDGNLIPYAKYSYGYGYRYYNNDSIDYKDKYGVLYYYNLNISNLCPSGWHVPTSGEWETLAESLGGKEIAGGKLKENGTTHWTSPNTGATNESGFTALPGGYFYSYEGGHVSGSAYVGIGTSGYWLSSTSPYSYTLNNKEESIKPYSGYSNISNSVRCKMDDDLINSIIPTVSTTEVFNILQRTASGGGKVIADGGSTVTIKGICWSVSPNPDTSNVKTNDGYATGNFSSFINNLKVNTTYYVRAYAINGVGVGYGNEVTFSTLEELNFGSLSDIDGNNYKSIKIGNQTWMAENLKTTHFSNGDSIPNVINNFQWEISTGAYSNYNNSSEIGKTYGKLYNFYAVSDAHNLCPSGWHIPTVGDWATLMNNLGGDKVAGIKLLESGTLHWPKTNKATNESGFTALPGGERSSYGSYYNLASSGYWWTSDGYYHYTYGDAFSNNQGNNTLGCSVRCMQDVDLETVSVPSLTTDSIIEIYQYIATSGGKIDSDGGASVSMKGLCWDTLPSPDISKFSSNNGYATGAFKSLLKNLKANTTYYVRAYAKNAKGTGYGNELSFKTKTELPYGSVTDIDGNTYKTIQINNITWMAENLRTTRYNNGDSIGTTVPSTKSISNESTPKYQWPGNNDISKVAGFGRLYTWYVASDNRNVCPSGWHVPADTNFKAMTDYLGGNSVASGKLKESRTTHWDWNATASDATNESGFSALPAGERSSYGSFYDNAAYWWCSNQYNSSNPYYFNMSTYNTNVTIGTNSRKYGMSIRCIKN